MKQKKNFSKICKSGFISEALAEEWLKSLSEDEIRKLLIEGLTSIFKGDDKAITKCIEDFADGKIEDFSKYINDLPKKYVK